MKRSGPLRRLTALRQRKPLERRPVERKATFDPRPTFSDWTHKRRRVLDRDGGCVAPGLGVPGRCAGILHVHHITPKGMGGSKRLDDESNLVTLCLWHHDWVHSHVAESTRLGLLRRRNT